MTTQEQTEALRFIANHGEFSPATRNIAQTAANSIDILSKELEEARELLRPMINGTHWITPEQTEAAREFLAKP